MGKVTRVKKIIFPLVSLLFIFLLMLSSALAATLQGTIYNENLEVEKNVLLEVNTIPAQKFLSKDGTYSFELSPGKYFLSARKGDLALQEEVEVKAEGQYTFDLFLLSDFTTEEDLWKDTEEDFFSDDLGETEAAAVSYDWWRYLAVGAIIIFALWRIVKARKKYGPLKLFRRKVKAESKKTLEQHKEELSREPGYLEKALEAIRKHEGRITQKELRKEMLYLSEAKVSLIVTEMEHKGKIEKIKKGRGNVLILKEESSG